MFRKMPMQEPLPSWPRRFGISSPSQLMRDLRTVFAHLPNPDRYAFDLRSAALLRPDLSLPAYAGLYPEDGIAPIFNFFDRTAGGKAFRYTVSRARVRDFRGGSLSYDEHDGTDFVCPPGTPMVAAAPGVLVAARNTWLRGGLTACIDHGHGLVTQYTHLTKLVVPLGTPLRRGEPFALSGVSGFDMTQFFPWVPPHVHFMSWVRGRPIDPYRRDDEPDAPGTWRTRNAPTTDEHAADGEHAPSLDELNRGIDARAVDDIMGRCRHAGIRAELDAAPTLAARAALLEDSLHHDRDAWPGDVDATTLRVDLSTDAARLTLPLPARFYRGAVAADAPWSRPPSRRVTS